MEPEDFVPEANALREEAADLDIREGLTLAEFAYTE